MPANVSVLFVGDIIGRPGRMAVEMFLPRLISQYRPSIVIGNGENAAGGIGITRDICRDMLETFDLLTSGNHVWDKKEGAQCLMKESRLIRPANYPAENPGQGTAVLTTKDGIKVGVMNLQGRVFMEALACPFRTADSCLEQLKKETNIVVVDIHAEATSEKQALGWYLDGRVSAVFGTHTHVPTADARILPEGTAYLTDAGMAGGYRSVIGIRIDQSIDRFLTSRPQRFEPAKGPLFLSAVFVEIDSETGKALSIVTETMSEEDCE